MSQSSELRSTHVVTCFLQRSDIQPPRILIVQRSQLVGTYHAHWAGVSGFVEPNVSPEEQAYTEIREETGLQRDQVRMIRRGTHIIDVPNEEAKREFHVHPFLFEVITPDAIKTDWEAVDMRWIEPSELSQYETVPGLQDAYDSAIHGEQMGTDYAH